MSGIQQSITVNRIGPLSWLIAPDLGELTAEKLHCMQEVRGWRSDRRTYPLPDSLQSVL
jgi:hypothetical protein